MTSYEDVYKAFLRKIEDLDLPQMDEVEQDDMLRGWLDDAIGYIELDDIKIRNDLSDRDDEQESFNVDLYNSEITVLSMYMVVAWYDQFINSAEHTLAFWGSKDERWTDQKNHLNALLETQRAYRVRARKYFRNYAYRHNDYIGTVEEESNEL